MPIEIQFWLKEKPQSKMLKTKFLCMRDVFKDNKISKITLKLMVKIILSNKFSICKSKRKIRIREVKIMSLS